MAREMDDHQSSSAGPGERYCSRCKNRYAKVGADNKLVEHEDAWTRKTCPGSGTHG